MYKITNSDEVTPNDVHSDDLGELEEFPVSKWVGYRHIKGHIKVKRLDPEFAKSLLDDLYDSDFVDEVTSVFEAKNRAEAEQIALAWLRRSE